MSIQIDHSKFIKNEQAGKWDVTIFLSGSTTDTVNAASKEEAEAIVSARIEEGYYEIHSSEADDANIDFVRPAPTMYLVLRNGEPMQTSRIQCGDAPRQPTESGF